MWFKRRHDEEPALRAEVAELRVTLSALRRDLEDLDETVRRLRGRRVKTEALDEREHAANGRLPTMAQLRAAGRSPFGG